MNRNAGAKCCYVLHPSNDNSCPRASEENAMVGSFWFRFRTAIKVATFGICFLVSVLGTAIGQDPATSDAATSTAGEAVITEEAAATAPHLAGTIDTGSTTWLMISAALVFFMMPGLALFYGGMVRSKNVLNMFMCVMVCVPIVTIQWVACGYSLAFAVPSAISSDAGKNDDGSDKPALSYLGWDSSLVFLKGFSDADPASPNYFAKIVTSGDTTGAAATGVPELLFSMFQMMFAIITPALIVGAIAERVKFSAWCIFVVLWATLVYDPVAHWVWMSAVGCSRKVCWTSQVEQSFMCLLEHQHWP